jgi:hypothetical protein
MRLPRQQRVSDLLYSIAGLIQEVDSYLRESDLFKSATKPLPAPKFKVSTGALEPHKVDRVSNSLRKTIERIDKPERDIMRAKRERKQRSRYQARKLVRDAPRKSFGTRLRNR